MAKEKWTIEKIKEGFDRFLNENGRLPIATEIDSLNYLPSSRLIEYRFGGLEKLRKTLGYKDVNFGKGKFRQKIAAESNKKGRKAELALEEFLRNKFGEVFVHTEKSFDNTKIRIDFYVYSPVGNFGIDVFYPDTMRNLEVNVNAKIDKYLSFPDKLYFVVANDNIKQSDIDDYIIRKKRKIPANATILTMDNLKKRLSSIPSFTTPIGLQYFKPFK